MVKIGVLVSGGGTNLEALLDAQDQGRLHSGQIALVVSSRAGAYALERAKQHGVESATLARKAFASQAEYDSAMVELLRCHDIDVVVLAGFLSVLGPAMVQAFPNHILNVHPSLIPSSSAARDMYGLKVHEAALARGRQGDGSHGALWSTRFTDGGPILLQKAVEVLPRRHGGDAAAPGDGTG